MERNRSHLKSKSSRITRKRRQKAVVVGIEIERFYSELTETHLLTIRLTLLKAFFVDYSS